MTRRRRRAAPRTAPPRTAPPAPAAEGGTFERARAAGALTPADHRRAEAVGGATRITIQGVALEVDPADVFGDYEVVESLALLNDGRGTPADVVRVTRAVLGEGRQKVMDHLRRPDGRVASEDLAGFLREVFEALAPGN